MIFFSLKRSYHGVFSQLDVRAVTVTAANLKLKDKNGPHGFYVVIVCLDFFQKNWIR